MKTLINTLLLVMLVQEVQAQGRFNLQPLIKYGKRLFGKTVPEASVYGTQFLSETSVANLRKMSPVLYEAIPSDNSYVVQNHGKFYLLHTYENRNETLKKFNSSAPHIIRYDFELADKKELLINDDAFVKIANDYALREHIKNNKAYYGIEETTVKSKEVEDVEIIQNALMLFGYDVKVDGSLGSKTKTAIEQAFGIKTTNKTPAQIVQAVFNRPKPKLKSSVQMYKLTVSNKNQPESADPKILQLNEHAVIEKLNNLKCGVTEICASLEKLHGSVNFDCEDKFGNKLSLTLSSESSVEFSFSRTKSESLKLAIDSDGKLTATAAKTFQ